MSIPGDGFLQFDWGDGTATETQPAANKVATHQYATNGAKAITVRATQADQATETGRGTGSFTVTPGVLQSMTPNGGPAAGGTPVTIVGTGLLGTTIVYFGAAQATNVAVVSDGLVTCTAPGGAPDALVNVNAFVRGVASNAVQYQYGPAEEADQEAVEAPEARGAPTIHRARSRAPRSR